MLSCELSKHLTVKSPLLLKKKTPDCKQADDDRQQHCTSLEPKDNWIRTWSFLSCLLFVYQLKGRDWPSRQLSSVVKWFFFFILNITVWLVSNTLGRNEWAVYKMALEWQVKLQPSDWPILITWPFSPHITLLWLATDHIDIALNRHRTDCS